MFLFISFDSQIKKLKLLFFAEDDNYTVIIMLKGIQKLVALDGSINWVIPFKKSKLECRYIRRDKKYISAYVSSHNGCVMGCKFCWLTATNQTNFNHVKLDEYLIQLDTILNEAKDYDLDGDKDDIRINVNFMARGEALANKIVVNNYGQLYTSYRELINKYGYKNLKMNVSTIMPNTIKDRTLESIFESYPVNICYSLYSLDENFRKKWMPNAMDCYTALNKLREFQEKTDNPITFHWAFIEGENDNIEEVQKIADTLKKLDFTTTKFNLVRFNPDPESTYKEPSEEKLAKIFNIINKSMTNNGATQKSRIISRVGYEVYASCGMFVE